MKQRLPKPELVLTSELLTLAVHAIKVATVVGARPQFIKASPVSRAIEASNSLARTSCAEIDEILVHTGQHYDAGLSDVFFKSLKLKTPKYNLGVGSGSHGKQLAKMIEGLESVLETERPDAVLVYGDTNSTLAGAVIAERLQIPVIHVEAGLRSFNRRMPEECNRVLTDHISSLLFAPTQTAVDNLLAEGIRKGVHLVGDVMYEAAVTHGQIAEKESKVLENLGIARRSYSLATVHRAENTDNPQRLSNIIGALLKISKSQFVVWPMHPRTRQRLSTEELNRFGATGLRVIDPVPYLDMLLLEKGANVILTDSGGVQKEAMWFQVPCVTLRDETEWIETVESGWNQIAGSSEPAICLAFKNAHRKLRPEFRLEIPDQRASKLIVEEIQKFAANHTRQRMVTG